MRVAGGEFCGLTLKTPRTGELRPTQDRVREALFSILSPEIPGADFLDLFAGSGAVGIEAMSRGAASATFVERDRRHLAVLSENLAATVGRNGRGASARTIAADVYSWVAGYSGPGFSIAFADPPYALGEERGYARLLSVIASRGVVRPGGIFIAEMTASQRPEEPQGWEILRDRRYGKTRICVWRRV